MQLLTALDSTIAEFNHILTLLSEEATVLIAII